MNIEIELNKKSKEINEFLKDTMFKQIDSIVETLQMVAMNEKCEESISKILFNQIGAVMLIKDEIKIL